MKLHELLAFEKGVPRIPPHLFGGSAGSSGPTAVTVSFSGLSNDFERAFAGMFMKMVRIGAIQLTAG